MTSGHTPGPWAWDGYSLRAVEPNPDGSAVHTILDAENIGWGYLESAPANTSAESAANLALIAAAPDLLCALKHALPLLDAHRAATGGEGDIAAALVRDAIAKAEGRA
jgi:hypothetical protein